MKFMEWVESVDHLVIGVDVGLSVFAAGLVTVSLRYLLAA
jgi:hypothetical protein